jgi:hypothetical protein
MCSMQSTLKRLPTATRTLPSLFESSCNWCACRRENMETPNPFFTDRQNEVSHSIWFYLGNKMTCLSETSV